MRVAGTMNVNGIRRSITSGEHAGAVAGGGDLVHPERVGERGESVDPGFEVLPGDHPHPHGVDRRGDRPHTTAPGARSGGPVWRWSRVSSHADRRRAHRPPR